MNDIFYVKGSLFKRIIRKFFSIKRKYSPPLQPTIDTSKEKVLDVGCGMNKEPGAIGIDIVKLDGVDIVHNLNITPWKGINDESFDWILMKDVLEHLDNTTDIMRECYRILKPGGKLFISVVYWNHKYAYSDPTHKHFYTEISFKFFTGEARPYYTDFKFRDLKIDYIFDFNAIRKFGNNRKVLFEKAYFNCNIIQGMHVILTK